MFMPFTLFSELSFSIHLANNFASIEAIVILGSVFEVSFFEREFLFFLPSCFPQTLLLLQ